VFGRDGERRQDHDEHEEVVDREALLDDVAREVLRSEVPPGDQPKRDPEAERDADEEQRRRDGLAKPSVCAWPGRDANRSKTNSAAISPIVAAHPAKVTSSTGAAQPTGPTISAGVWALWTRPEDTDPSTVAVTPLRPRDPLTITAASPVMSSRDIAAAIQYGLVIGDDPALTCAAVLRRLTGRSVFWDEMT
jgi:hypothetical protein